MTFLTLPRILLPMKILPETLPDTPTDVTPEELATVATEQNSESIRLLMDKNVFVTFADKTTAVGRMTRAGEIKFTIGTNPTVYSFAQVSHIREV